VEASVQTHTDGHVLFEGFVVSKSGSRWLEFAARQRRANQGRYVWVFLRPPVSLLMERIRQRSGGKSPNQTLLENTCRTVDLIRNKAKQADRGAVLDLDHTLTPEGVFEQLLSGLSKLETQA
jgi:hypothetical protein